MEKLHSSWYWEQLDRAMDVPWKKANLSSNRLLHIFMCRTCEAGNRGFIYHCVYRKNNIWRKEMLLFFSFYIG